MNRNFKAGQLDLSVSRRLKSQAAPSARHPSSNFRPSEQAPAGRPEVALLTGGADKPYALGLAAALVAQGIFLDFIGSDEINSRELHETPQVNFLNLRGDQRPDASQRIKAKRVAAYYFRLLRYATSSRAKVFHILWNNKFEWFDRTLLMLYYRLLRKKIIFTAHNVNSGKRDSNDTLLNRLSLKTQYSLAHHIFVHTANMKSELVAEFGVPEDKATVIPFGINNTLPTTVLASAEAKQILGLNPAEKAVLFFGSIAPYKGLEYLVAAFDQFAGKRDDCRLIIAGRPKNCEGYWNSLQATIARCGTRKQIIQAIEHIPDEKVEVYFKAADVLVLPYTEIFQSGVLFLGYSFGLPVIAADVGSLKEDIIEDETGFTCRPKDPADLANALDRYFFSNLFRNLETSRARIREYANQRNSWATVGQITARVYRTAQQP